MTKFEDEIVGIAIFNDDKTNAYFVVDLLRNEFQLEKNEAVALTKQVHDRGFGIIKSLTRAEACRQLEKAQAVVERFGQPLVLRIVDDPTPIVCTAAPKRRELIPNKFLVWIIRLLIIAAVTFFLIWIVNQ